jgi:hypothetical protein
VSVNFDMAVDSCGCDEVAKAERAKFFHALEAKVKKIMKNLACAPIGRRWIGFPEDDVN